VPHPHPRAAGPTWGALVTHGRQRSPARCWPPAIVRRMRERSGGQIVADTLQANRIGAAFCVPGESFLAVLDAL
jgi:hypothetical protein